MIDDDREANWLDPTYAFCKHFIRILDFQHSMSLNESQVKGFLANLFIYSKLV